MRYWKLEVEPQNYDTRCKVYLFLLVTLHLYLAHVNEVLSNTYQPQHDIVHSTISATCHTLC